MSQIPVQKTVFDKDAYTRVINTRFNQLLSTEEETPSFTVDDFFELYEQLFYQLENLVQSSTQHMQIYLFVLQK